MELICYPLLSTRSKRAIHRTRKRWGKLYNYIPRITLVRRLAQELGMSEHDVRKQIEKEREYIISDKPISMRIGTG